MMRETLAGQATSRARLRLLIPPDATFGRYVRSRIASFAAASGIVDCDLDDFMTGIGEALANAIEHSGTRRPIEVTAWLADRHELLATIVDAGVGFAADEANPHLPADDLAERGRGLSIMRRCSDVFTIRSAPGQGTAVTLGRFLRRKAARPRQAAAG